MSTYWGYHCVNCDQTTDHMFNRGEDRLVEFYHAYQLLEKHMRNWIWVDLTILGGGISDVSQIEVFLGEHWGHLIVLHNEYRETKEIPALDAGST